MGEIYIETSKTKDNSLNQLTKGSGAQRIGKGAKDANGAFYIGKITIKASDGEYTYNDGVD